MSFNRTSLRVAIGLLAMLLASPALGQGPLGMQLFAPADTSTYGGDIEPNEGYFFQFDGLYWSMTAPKTQVIGKAGLTPTVYYGAHPINAQDPLSDARTEVNTLSTSELNDQFSAGTRFEFGRVEDGDGWLVSIFQLKGQSQWFLSPQADVVFQDTYQGQFGLLNGPIPIDPTDTKSAVVSRRLPVTLYNVIETNFVTTWGVEANFLHRLHTFHEGSTIELFGGARYFEFNDEFGVQAGSDPGTTTIPSFLADSSWYTTAQNHIVGPQVGARYFKKRGRWMFSTEGRFMAGLNCQNVHQWVNIGPHLNSGGLAGSQWYTPSAMGPTTGSTSAYERVFSPMVELRLEGRYQITRALSFHAGWTGMWVDNVARANSMVKYDLPALGIDMTNNKQYVFVNGVTIGFDFNR